MAKVENPAQDWSRLNVWLIYWGSLISTTSHWSGERLAIQSVVGRYTPALVLV